LTARLSAALALWDIQAHRSLTVAPTASNLTCVARVQALITTAAAVIADAAAAHGHLDHGTTERFTPLAEASQLAWTRTAHRWSELITPAARTHPPLLGAASQLRAALAATVQGEHGWAPADTVTSRVDLPAALDALNLAIAGGTEIGHVIRGIATSEPTLTAPARIIGMRTQAEVERDTDRGETRYLGVEWVTARQIRDNQPIPLPEPARRGLVDIAGETAATSSRALAAFIVPHCVTHQEPTRPTPSPPPVHAEATRMHRPSIATDLGR